MRSRGFTNNAGRSNFCSAGSSSILKIRAFLGRPETAIRIQILAAMIAFLLLRIAARNSRSTLSPIRFAGLVRRCLFARKPLARLDKPPEVNPSKPKSKDLPGQMEISYA